MQHIYISVNIAFIVYSFIMSAYMSEKNIKARKLYWSKLSKEERSERMRAVALKRYEGMTMEERKMIGKNLAISRKKAIINK